MSGFYRLANTLRYKARAEQARRNALQEPDGGQAVRQAIRWHGQHQKVQGVVHDGALELHGANARRRATQIIAELLPGLPLPEQAAVFLERVTSFDLRIVDPDLPSITRITEVVVFKAAGLLTENTPKLEAEARWVPLQEVISDLASTPAASAFRTGFEVFGTAADWLVGLQEV